MTAFEGKEFVVWDKAAAAAGPPSWLPSVAVNHEEGEPDFGELSRVALAEPRLSHRTSCSEGRNPPMVTVLEQEPAKAIEPVWRRIVVFLLLTFGSSSLFQYLIVSHGGIHKQGGALLAIPMMWCPGIAAIVTQLIFCRSLRGMGWGKTRYQAAISVRAESSGLSTATRNTCRRSFAKWSDERYFVRTWVIASIAS
jgi:hypothetical protein